MKQVKRIAKLLVFVLLIFMASIGIGITGAAPTELFKRGIDKNNETKVEQVEEQGKDIRFSRIREIN